MSKQKVWSLHELLDRIWALSKGKRTAVAGAVEGKHINPSLPGYGAIKRVVTGWDEDYKPRTYELNKISAASAAALYERIKAVRTKEAAAGAEDRREVAAWRAGFDAAVAQEEKRSNAKAARPDLYPPHRYESAVMDLDGEVVYED